MEHIIAVMLRSLYNSGFAIGCVMFVLPRRRMKWWQTMLVLAMTVTGYCLMRYAYVEWDNFLLGGILEYCVFVIPVLMISAGDPWRNILLRLIFQITALMFYYFEYAAFLVIMSKEEMEEYWFDKFEIGSIADEMYKGLFILYEIVPTCIILRLIVKRWSSEHKKAYTWIVLSYMSIGLISGLVKLRKWHSGELDNYAIVTVYVIPGVFLVLITNMLYTRYEKQRLRNLNLWYEEKMNNIGGDTVKTSLHDYIEAWVLKIESKGITVNCFDGMKDVELTTELELLLDRLLVLIADNDCSTVEAGFMMANNAKVISLELAGAGVESISDEKAGIGQIVMDMGGTLLIEGRSLSVMLLD